MIIYKPPLPTTGAVNLSKGTKVFDEVVRGHDMVISLDFTDLDQTISELKRVHDPEYVRLVMEGKCPNGYQDTNEISNLHSVASCKIMADAINWCKDQPVFAPVSGFHHACYSQGGGYCTFNGLILAADLFRAKNPNAQILIVDGDGHFGNGTCDLINRDRLWVTNCSLGINSVQADATKALAHMRSELLWQKWDLVLYQAGADSHKDDPYGAGYLTDEDWFARDRMVFSICKKQGYPLIFNLAGGYAGQKTVNLHSSTVDTFRFIYER